MRFTRRRETHGCSLNGATFFLLIQQLLLEFLAQSHQKLVLTSSRLKVWSQIICRHLGISAKCALATHLFKGSSLKALRWLPLPMRLSLHCCHWRGAEQIRLNGKGWVTNGARALGNKRKVAPCHRSGSSRRLLSLEHAEDLTCRDGYRLLGLTIHHYIFSDWLKEIVGLANHENLNLLWKTIIN